MRNLIRSPLTWMVLAEFMVVGALVVVGQLRRRPLERLVRQATAHGRPPSVSRSRWMARNRWRFTLPSLTPSVAATWAVGRSST